LIGQACQLRPILLAQQVQQSEYDVAVYVDMSSGASAS
jgi:hypothetical protein